MTILNYAEQFDYDSKYKLQFLVKEYTEPEYENLQAWSDSPETSSSDGKHKSVSSIYLPVPNISDNQSISYNFDKTSSGGVGGIVLDMVKGLSSMFGELNFIEQAMAQKGMAMMPNRIQRFESTEARTFDFNFTFNPKSEKEAEMVAAVLMEFKYNSLPEASKSNAKEEFEKLRKKLNKDNPDTEGNERSWGALVSRLEESFKNTAFEFFDIVDVPRIFHIHLIGHDKNSPFKNMILFKPSFLTNISIDYGGDEMLMFEDGTPSVISLTMSFTEITDVKRQDLTKQRNEKIVVGEST